MRYPLLLLYICATLCLPAQEWPPRKAIGRELALFGSQFVSGASYGLVESLQFRYDRFTARHPGHDPLFWNPKESWRNKWRGGDPALGERFPGSSTIFVWTTDAYHLFRTVERMSWVGSITLQITIGEKKPWHYYAWAVARSYVGFWCGHAVTYKWLYRRP